MAKNIQLIIGSTRQNRLADDVVAWITARAKQYDNINLEVIDLKEQDLPFFNAPVSPSQAPDTSAAGKAWSEVVSQADGYIFLTPEYNRSIPAALKNALDYLVAEWKGKPAGIVSYGWIDGGQSAVRHLKDIASWLKLNVSSPEVALKLEAEFMDENGHLRDPDHAFAAYDSQLAEVFRSLA